MTKAVVKELWTNTLRNQAGTREFASCTAWVNFDGTATPTTIRDSLNVSSITDNGTGDYTVNFEQDMDNVDYCYTQSASREAGEANYQILSRNRASADSISSCRFQLRNSTGSIVDRNGLCVAFFGGID